MTDAMDIVLKARAGVARQNEFFAGIAFQAKIIERSTSPTGYPTMWTNGINVFFHPDFVLQNKQHVPGVLLHEILHCALLHVPRGKDKNPLIWNHACDHPVNYAVKQAGFSLPEGHLYALPYIHKNAERNYALMEQEQQKKQSEQDDEQSEGEQSEGEQSEGEQSEGEQSESEQSEGEQSEGEQSEGEQSEGERRSQDKPPQPSCPMQEPSEKELEQAAREWRAATFKAADKARRAGSFPASCEKLVKELIPSAKLDWKTLLEQLAKDAKAPQIGAWNRVNRRHLGAGRRMPGQTCENISKLVVCFDVSGSVDLKQQQEMRQEIMNLLDQNLITHAVLIATDTEIRGEVTECTSSQEVSEFPCMPGGGTHFAKAMEAVGEIEDAIGCVFLTDMCVSDGAKGFGDDPGIPMIWVDWLNCTNQYARQTPPFGQVFPYQEIQD